MQESKQYMVTVHQNRKGIDTSTETEPIFIKKKVFLFNDVNELYNLFDNPEGEKDTSIIPLLEDLFKEYLEKEYVYFEMEGIQFDAVHIFTQVNEGEFFNAHIQNMLENLISDIGYYLEKYKTLNHCQVQFKKFGLVVELSLTSFLSQFDLEIKEVY